MVINRPALPVVMRLLVRNETFRTYAEGLFFVPF